MFPMNTLPPGGQYGTEGKVRITLTINATMTASHHQHPHLYTASRPFENSGNMRKDAMSYGLERKVGIFRFIFLFLQRRDNLRLERGRCPNSKANQCHGSSESRSPGVRIEHGVGKSKSRDWRAGYRVRDGMIWELKEYSLTFSDPTLFRYQSQ